MNVKVITHPQKKEELNINKKIEQIVQERSKAIANELKTEVVDIEVNLYADGSAVASKVGRTSDDRLGIFSGYVDYEPGFHIAHPTGVEPIFGENLWKQIGIMIDFCLYKFYLCQIYFPKGKPYKLYYKYLTDSVAKLLSGNYNKESILFEIRQFNDAKRYKKDTELQMTFYVMLEKSDSTMITDNLNELYETCNIQKSLMKIYKKEFKELIGLYQKEMIQQDKELKKLNKIIYQKLFKGKIISNYYASVA